MNQAEMRKKICPIMSRADVTDPSLGFVSCQGSDCAAFNSRPGYIYLGKDGKETTTWGDRASFEPIGIQSSLVKEILDNGWIQEGLGLLPRDKVSFNKPDEPNCWCDAMAGNAQCGYEAP